MKHLLIIIFSILGIGITTAQKTVTNVEVLAGINAGEGDLYIHETSHVIYIGLSNGSYHPINKNLKEILEQANDANNLKITNLALPINPNDAATKQYVDNLTGNTNWLLSGNNPTPGGAHFLGTINDTKMQIRSNNLPMLEFGRRATLGLVAAYLDYDNSDQAIVHLNGDGNTAALQFAASEADFYKPMFFTTTNGSFRLKGSSGKSDLFEIGSAGPLNEGRLEFIIGDDGAEPIIFKRYDYRNSKSHSELFRVQGSSNSADAKTRFGININPVARPIVTDYGDDANIGYNIANSTLQVNGSISTSIFTTTQSLTLSEDHHTLIIGGNHSITLPDATITTGRNYIIKNPTSNSITVNNYVDAFGNEISTLLPNRILLLQSDGSKWQQINNSNTTTTTPTLNVTKETIGYIFAASHVNWDGLNNGYNINVTDASITRTDPGRYSVLFTSPHPNGYYYDITFGYKGNTDRDGRNIQVLNQDADGFTIEITTGDNGGTADTYVDSTWYFNVTSTKEVITNVSLN